MTLVQDLHAIRFLYDGKKKISHDYMGKDVRTFSYRELWNNPNVPCIGLPCKQNGLVVVDVDVAGTTHQYDGREYWQKFSEEFGIPPTYTVSTPSGGFHYYFKIPASVNPDTFHPPDELAQGVDIKWNGWIGAPPTQGYNIVWGDLTQVRECPPALMAEFSRLRQGGHIKTYDPSNPGAGLVEMHRPFNATQLQEIWEKIHWVQQNATLSRSEWRDGIFALKAGIHDDGVLDQYLIAWTINKSYVQGDEEQARAIASRADRYGSIGPGTIFKILNDIRIREGAPVPESPLTIQEILDKSKVHKKISKDGSLIIEASESNAGALLGAVYDEKTLYHDTRSDLYIYKGRSHSDAELVSMFLPMLQSPAYGLGLEKFRKSTVSGGLDVLMATRRIDPHLEYLKSLEWDGTPRIETFFSRYVGAEDSEYIRRVGLNFWTALAARGLQPGCKFDSMIILEGREGINKSSLIEAIGGQYTFAPIKKEFANDLDILRQMHQAVIVELPELIGLINQSSEFVKAFLAKPFDNIRGLFARKAMRNERGFVFVGTTNSDKYLAAAMGMRRFWPVKIPAGTVINLSGIKADRDQLFAEAIHMFKANFEFWHMPKELLAPIVNEKILEEPLTAPIREIIENSPTYFSTVDVYRRLEVGGFITRGMTSHITSRIENTLVTLECVRDVNGWRAKDSMASRLMNEMSSVAATVPPPQTAGLSAFL